jgi:hypothetical protein
MRGSNLLFLCAQPSKPRQGAFGNRKKYLIIQRPLGPRNEGNMKWANNDPWSARTFGIGGNGEGNSVNDNPHAQMTEYYAPTSPSSLV